MEKVRVLRVLEYAGPRDRIETVVASSIQGTKVFGDCAIRAATIGAYPEVLTADPTFLAGFAAARAKASDIVANATDGDSPFDSTLAHLVEAIDKMKPEL